MKILRVDSSGTPATDFAQARDECMLHWRSIALSHPKREEGYAFVMRDLVQKTEYSSCTRCRGRVRTTQHSPPVVLSSIDFLFITTLARGGEVASLPYGPACSASVWFQISEIWGYGQWKTATYLPPRTLAFFRSINGGCKLHHTTLTLGTAAPQERPWLCVG